MTTFMMIYVGGTIICCGSMFVFDMFNTIYGNENNDPTFHKRNIVRAILAIILLWPIVALIIVSICYVIEKILLFIITRILHLIWYDNNEQNNPNKLQWYREWPIDNREDDSYE